MCSDRRPAAKRVAARLALGLALGSTLLACGNRKPPKAPPRMVATAAGDLEVAQRGNELQFSFAYPTVTVGGLPLPGLEAVELLRMSKPLAPQPEEGEEPTVEEGGDGEEPAAAEETAAEEPTTEAPPPSPFLFRRPDVEEILPAEERVRVDAREFVALAEVALRIEGPELTAAISGDRVLLRLPLPELPPPDVPEEQRDLEVFAVVTVTQPRGLVSEISNLVTILPRTPPEPPDQIETRPGPTGVDVIWRADDPTVGFRVYRRDAASRVYGLPIAQPTPEARSHLDQTAVFGSRYVYSVTAVAQESPRLESALGAELEVQYDDRYPPAAPGGLVALAEPGRARLLWEPSAASDLAGYLVYRRGPDGDAYERLTAEPSRELEYLDTAVASGRGYGYYVSAVDLEGNESEASETVDVRIP